MSAQDAALSALSDVELRDAIAFQLHAQGEPAAIIAEQLGVSVGAARAAVIRGREQVIERAALDAEAVWADAYESTRQLLASAVACIPAEGSKAVTVALKVRERLDLLGGLNPAKRLELSFTGDDVDGDGQEDGIRVDLHAVAAALGQPLPEADVHELPRRDQ